LPKIKVPSNFVHTLIFDLSRSTGLVDRPYDRSSRSTVPVDRGSGSRAYQCARFTIDRAVDRSMPDCNSVALCLFGSTGRSIAGL